MTIHPFKKEIDVLYCKLYLLAAGTIAIAVGAFVLLRWALDVEVFKSQLPDYAMVKPNSAMCFILSGIALIVVGRRSVGAGVADRGLRRIGLVSSGMVAIVAAATLVEYFFSLDLKIDSLIIPDALGGANAIRMAATTALAFSFIGVGLALHHVQSRIGRRFAEILSFATLALGSGGLDGLRLWRRIAL